MSTAGAGEVAYKLRFRDASRLYEIDQHSDNFRETRKRDYAEPLKSDPFFVPNVYPWVGLEVPFNERTVGYQSVADARARGVAILEMFLQCLENRAATVSYLPPRVDLPPVRLPLYRPLHNTGLADPAMLALDGFDGRPLRMVFSVYVTADFGAHAVDGETWLKGMLDMNKHDHIAGTFARDRALLGIVDSKTDAGQPARRVDASKLQNFSSPHTGKSFEYCRDDFRLSRTNLGTGPTPHAVGHFVIVDKTIFDRRFDKPCIVVRDYMDETRTMMVERSVLFQHLIPLEMGMLSVENCTVANPYSLAATLEMLAPERRADQLGPGAETPAPPPWQTGPTAHLTPLAPAPASSSGSGQAAPGHAGPSGSGQAGASGSGRGGISGGGSGGISGGGRGGAPASGRGGTSSTGRGGQNGRGRGGFRGH